MPAVIVFQSHVLLSLLPTNKRTEVGTTQLCPPGTWKNPPDSILGETGDEGILRVDKKEKISPDPCLYDDVVGNWDGRGNVYYEIGCKTD